MRVDINLATKPYEDSRRFWVYWGTGIALLSLATALLMFFAVTGFIQANRDRKIIAKLNSDIARFDNEKLSSEAVLNEPKNRAMRQQSQFLNELCERKSFSWTRVFEDLEQVMPAHLHVVSIHPDVSSDNTAEIKLVVGGESREQALDLVRKMESSKRFKQTRIDQVKFAEERNSQVDPVEFQIVTSYVPPSGPQEQKTSGGLD
jgi:Tfp pilus assembly protein PilN